MKFLLFFLVAFVAAAPALAELSPAERRMVERVDAEQQRTTDLLERLVNQNSGTMNFAGVEAVAQMVRAELEPLGFEVRWVPMQEAGRAGHLLAVHRGDGKGRRMLLIAHLDTVFEKDSPFQKFVRQGDRAEGPGVVDDKGGIAVIVAALRAMDAAGTLKRADIEVVLTGDEEDVGAPQALARADLLAAGERAEVALDFEGLSIENGRDMGVVARRSSSSWELRTRGRGGHSSGIFSAHAGYGAIYEMARILNAFRERLPEANLTLNTGIVTGGTNAALGEGGITGTASGKTNIIPEVAIARGDTRTLSREQEERVRAAMQAIVATNLPGTSAELVFDEGGYPPMAPSAGNRALLARLNEVNRDLGLPPMEEYDPARRGAADISFVAEQTDGLAGLGPAGEGSHAPGEAVDLTSIARQAKRAAILMSRLAAQRNR